MGVESGYCGSKVIEEGKSFWVRGRETCVPLVSGRCLSGENDKMYSGDGTRFPVEPGEVDEVPTSEERRLRPLRNL